MVNKLDQIQSNFAPDEENQGRDLMEDEEQLLRKFDANDAEIDSLLDGVIDKLDRLKYSAQQINQGMAQKDDLIEQLDKKMELSKRRLQKKDSSLKKILQQYKDQNRFCIYILLIIIIIVLLGLIQFTFREKGYI